MEIKTVVSPESNYENGVFWFTNATDQDFTVLWNNKEYTYPAKSSAPMLIPNEPSENIQEIRKKFAYKLALREFHLGKEYTTLVKLGNKSAGGTPPLYDDKILEPVIESCLKPLPVTQAKVKEGKKMDDRIFRGSKAVSKNQSLNEVFKDEVPVELGQMSE